MKQEALVEIIRACCFPTVQSESASKLYIGQLIAPYGGPEAAAAEIIKALKAERDIKYDLDELVELSAIATQGEWETDTSYEDEDFDVISIGSAQYRGSKFVEDTIGQVWSMNKSSEEFEANAAFVVACVNFARAKIRENNG